jgi:beta-lactamase class A
MCSTFKWLAAACVLQRVDAGKESLQRRVHFDRSVLLPHSPLTTPHAGADGMTIAQLCEAAITQSDNAAANLLLQSFGGPAGLTAFARSLGDPSTRLDRREPALNEARPGDPRDTTTPRAMAHLLHAALVGDALRPRSRAQLAGWMQACETNGQRLRADLPASWRMGSKTGSGAHGTSNDVGIFWPPGGAPVVVAVYLTGSEAADAERDRAIARVAAAVTSRNR